MNYLFFDIECANCDEGRGKICSFGYVLTDEGFNVIKRDDIVINPKAPFHLQSYGSNRRQYIELAYPEEVFKAAPSFSAFYDELKALLVTPENLVFGYAPENDAGFLSSEFDRYKLTPLDFTFCDVQRMFKHFINGVGGGNQVSLVHACEALNINTPETVHKSEDDAEATMRVLKHICLATEKTPSELIGLYAPCTGSLKDGELYVSYFKKREALAPGEENMMKGINEDRFKLLMRRTVRDSNDLGNVPALRGRRICFSGAYERYRYKEMCVLLQLIVKGGGKLTRKVRDCNTYISCHRVKKPDGRNAYCPRKKAVDELIAQGRKIQSVPFRALLGWLGIDEAELDRLAFPEKYNITEAEADFSEAKGLEIEPAEA